MAAYGSLMDLTPRRAARHVKLPSIESAGDALKHHQRSLVSVRTANDYERSRGTCRGWFWGTARRSRSATRKRIVALRAVETMPKAHYARLDRLRTARLRFTTRVARKK